MPGGKENWAPGQIQASFGHSAKLYDRAQRRGDAVAVPFGRYLLLKRIKRGGMAEIYRAKAIGSEGFQKIVAIKRILPHLAQSDDFVSMFIDEAKIVAILNHQNICPVIELGRCQDGLYIVMEYIWGRDLRQVLNRMSRHGRLIPLTVAAHIAGRIAEGLDYAHRRTGGHGEPLNIVHRDISPQNILLSYDGEVKVIDFGIARASQRSTQTRVGTFKGKFAYMSPEQARGKQLDRRSDVFALGILLHEMVTGSRLFAADNDLDTLDRVRNCQVPHPTRPFEDVPAALADIAMRALQRDPQRRYQWAGEMQEDLDRFLMQSGELATASRLGTWICLNFSEHAARALIDQERAARATAPGMGGSEPSSEGSDGLQHRHQPPGHSQYGPIPPTEASRTDMGSVSYTTDEPVEESSTFTEDIDIDVEFEVDDGLLLFDGNDAPSSDSETSTPLPGEAFDNALRSERASRSSWTGSSEVMISDGEASSPDVRDTVPPNPRASQTGSGSWSNYPESPPSRTQRAAPKTPTPRETGIEISADVGAPDSEDDLVILDDLPPPKSGKSGA